MFQLRRELLAEVEAIAAILAKHAAASEVLARLNEPSIQALRKTRLLRFICPKERGGEEVDPITHLEIIEALAKINGSAAWTIGDFGRREHDRRRIPTTRFKQKDFRRRRSSDAWDVDTTRSRAAR
jgi:alkylation response protein AidB-like acyl-CoA dehydrogenase